MKKHLWKIAIISLIITNLSNIFNTVEWISELTQTASKLCSLLIFYLIVDRSEYIRSNFSSIFGIGILAFIVSIILKVLHHPFANYAIMLSPLLTIIPYTIFVILKKGKPIYRIFLLFFVIERAFIIIVVFLSIPLNDNLSLLIDATGTAAVCIAIYLKYHQDSRLSPLSDNILDDTFLIENQQNT